MLVALNGTARIHAASAEKGPDFRCLGCGEAVTLRKGTRVVHHFAHKPPVTCAWAVGETHGHLAAKNLLMELFEWRGFEADVEYPVGKQRADVHVLGKRGRPHVFEIQHQPITPAEISARTEGYFAAGAAVTSISLIDIAKFGSKAKKTATGYVIDRYPPKPFERWLHGFHFKEPWFFEPSTLLFWRGTFSAAIIDVPLSEWRVSRGGLASAGGYSRHSKKWRTLTLDGPYPVNLISFGVETRPASAIGDFSYPGGRRITMAGVMLT
jgi:competence protein CoiA